MTTAAIYARFSSDNQREESIDAQIRAIKEYCQKNDIEIVASYIDEARSATTDDRPQFLKMIRDSSANQWDMVIVHKLDRFARNRYDSAFYKRELRKAGCRLVSVTEQLDDSPESIILESVLEGMAEYYSRNLAREVMKGLKENAMKGKFCGGIPPLGYDIEDGHYIVNETEARWVRTIFEMYAAGASYGDILDKLNSIGAKTKRGRPFGKNSLYSILKNEKYTGTYVFNKGTKKIHNIEKEDVIRIPEGIPAIISRELFEQAQKRLSSRQTRAAGKAKEVYLLSGLVYCGECGSAFVGNRVLRAGKSYAYYECNNKKRTGACSMRRISKPKIEGKALSVLQKSLFSKEVIPSLAKRIDEHYRASQRDLADEKAYLERELKKIADKNEKLLDAIEAGEYSPIIARRLKENEQAAETYRKRLTELKLLSSSNVVTEDTLKAYLLTYAQSLKQKNTDDLKEIVSTFIDKVTVYRDSIDIALKINPAMLGLDTTGSGGGLLIVSKHII